MSITLPLWSVYLLVIYLGFGLGVATTRTWGTGLDGICSNAAKAILEVCWVIALIAMWPPLLTAIILERKAMENNERD